MASSSTPLSYAAFAAQFQPHAVPELLRQLFALEQVDPAQLLSEGFYLNYIDKTGLETYSTDPAFKQSFIEFANANFRGSTYACWLTEAQPEQCPIVVFGDEGGM